MWYNLLFWASGLLWSFSALFTNRNTSTAPTVTLKNGSYIGVYSPFYKQDFFLGIPYAVPPVGDLRFRPPQHLDSTWEDSRAADAYSAACVGYGGDEIHYKSLSEDCLYLNVIRPSGISPSARLPVAFWMHGGGFFQGSTQDKRYNLSFIVEQSVEIGMPIIGVSINYRLSAWGFLLGKEVQESGNTNLGMRDQRVAMQWVQENIEAFGGDPRKVTIWGESAGANSVGTHILAYSARNDSLFRAGIMQSGGPIFYYPMTPVQKHFDTLVSNAGCSKSPDKVSCLRNLPFEKLNAAINTTEDLTQRWHPVVDGDLIPARPSEMLKNGTFLKVPVIVGANSDEGSIFSPRFVATEEDFYNHLIHNSSFHPFFAAKIPPDFAKEVIKAYPDIPSLGIPAPPTLPANFRPQERFGAHFRRSSAYYGDAVFIAPRRKTCETWAENGTPIWCYRFNTISAGVPKEIAVTHFQEIAYVMQNRVGGGQGYYLPPVPPFLGKPESYSELSRLMGKSWISFIVEGDPNAWRKRGLRERLLSAVVVGEDDGGRFGVTPRWPTYNVETPLEIVWDADVPGLAHLGMDTYRGEAIVLINSVASTVFDR